MKFSQALFWDTDINTIDPILHKRYVIERILRLGNLDDYRWMRNVYSVEDVKNVILEERLDLDPKSINFWCHSFGIEESICTKKLLAKTQELFYYPYPLLFPTKEYKGVFLADERDIGAMKVQAISGRGSKKDFVDLFVLLKKYSIQELFDFFHKKYEKFNYNQLLI